MSSWRRLVSAVTFGRVAFLDVGARCADLAEGEGFYDAAAGKVHFRACFDCEDPVDCAVQICRKKR